MPKPVQDKKLHKGVQTWARDINQLYRKEAALYESDLDSAKFERVGLLDPQQSITQFPEERKDSGRDAPGCL